jgi:hypothetical protein
MTTPDKGVPPIFGAITNQGLSMWAALTQEQWIELMREDMREHIDPLTGFFDGVNKGLADLGELIKGIIEVLGGDGSGVTAAVKALQKLVGWIAEIASTLQELLDGIAGVAGATVGQAVALIAGIIREFWAFIHGLVGGNGTVAQAIALINGLKSTLQEFIDGLAGTANATVAAAIAALNKLKADVLAVVGNFQSFLDGLAGTANATVAAALAALNKVKTDLQSLIDGIWKAFTGGTSIGHSVTEAVTSITNWLLNSFQTLVDGIANVFIPGAGRPIADAIASIGNIFTTASNADSSAANAHAEIEAIKAQQASGFADVFEIPNAPALLAPWVKKSTIADTYGPDGNGSAVGKMSGTGLGMIWYVNTQSVPGADIKVTATLSRNPWWDLLVKSSWFLMVQGSASDSTCYGVEIKNTTCTFFQMDAAGTRTTLGAADRQIAANAVGVPYTLEIKGTTLSLYRNHILQHNAPISAPLSGRLIGFGGSKVAYTNVNDNPLAQFAGISWQPA